MRTGCPSFWQRERWEAWPRDLPQVSLDTTSPLEDQVAFVLAILRDQYLNAYDTPLANIR